MPPKRPSQSTAECEPLNAHERLQEAIMSRVIENLNVEGLAQMLLDEVARKFAAQVHVETLVETLLREQENELKDLLARRVLDQLMRL